MINDAVPDRQKYVMVIYLDFSLAMLRKCLLSSLILIKHLQKLLQNWSSWRHLRAESVVFDSTDANAWVDTDTVLLSEVSKPCSCSESPPKPAEQVPCSPLRCGAKGELCAPGSSWQRNHGAGTWPHGINIALPSLFLAILRGFSEV